MPGISLGRIPVCQGTAQRSPQPTHDLNDLPTYFAGTTQKLASFRSEMRANYAAGPTQLRCGSARSTSAFPTRLRFTSCRVINDRDWRFRQTSIHVQRGYGYGSHVTPRCNATNCWTSCVSYEIRVPPKFAIEPTQIASDPSIDRAVVQGDRDHIVARSR